MKRENITLESLFDQLYELGVRKGDTLFIAADLMRLNYFNKSRLQTLDDITNMLLSLVGDEGTIVIPSYTQTFYRFKKNPNLIFEKGKNSTSGNLSNHLLNHPNVIRSNHPTNSVLAIGRNADFITRDHDENSSSYLPLLRVIQLEGKNLMLGCFTDFSLAPMALHAAQEKLGYTLKNWRSGLLQTYYHNNDNKRKIFTRYGIGGCSSGAHKALSYHFKAGAIKVMSTGKSLSAIIDTKKSYAIFLNLLNENPEYLRCEDKTCHDCYGSSIYNPRYYIFHWIGFLLKKIFSSSTYSFRKILKNV